MANVNSSLGLLEKFEQNIEVLANCCNSILDNDNRLIAQNIIQETKQLLNIFEDSFNPIELSDRVKLSGLTFKSKIYSLGLENEIVRQREAGKPILEISNLYNISTTAITRFLTHYDQLNNVEQAKIKTKSVMNTPERLEELMALIMRQLNRLEGVNDEIHVKYIGELRQTFGLAAQLTEKLATYVAYEEFKKKVQEILCTELPDRRKEIIKILQLNQSSPLPLNPVNY